MNKEEIIYFEVDHWAAGEDYPNEEPFLTWMDDYNLDKYLRNEVFIKEHKLCVKTFPIDMSINFMVTAPKSFVEKMCPTLLTNPDNAKFICHIEQNEDTPESRYIRKEYFLPYTKENIGKLQYGENWY